MKKAVNLIVCAGVIILLAGIAKLILEACSPCMHKYFEVEKD